MFFDVGFSEIFLLAVLGLLILGPERLPSVARTLGGWVRRGRKMAAEFQSELEREVDLKEFKQLKHEVEQAAQPLREAVETLDEGNSILDKTLRDANRPIEPDSANPQISAENKAASSGTLEPHEPMRSTESSDNPDPVATDAPSIEAAPAKSSD